jgi:4-amino-4-deoxychorismate lyase
LDQKNTPTLVFDVFESICYHDGQFLRLEYHQARVNLARASLYQSYVIWEIEPLLESYRLRQILLPNQSYKFRIDYNQNEFQITHQPYVTKEVKILQIIDLQSLKYTHKYVDRTLIDQYKASSKADDIWFCLGGFMSDTSYCNVILEKQEKGKSVFVTPTTPLLQGTYRAYLLKTGIITAEKIHKSDLAQFTYVHLVNAMIPIGRLRILLSNCKYLGQRF